MAKIYTAEDIEALSARKHVRLRPNLYFKSCFEEKILGEGAFQGNPLTSVTSRT